MSYAEHPLDAIERRAKAMGWDASRRKGDDWLSLSRLLGEGGQYLSFHEDGKLFSKSPTVCEHDIALLMNDSSATERLPLHSTSQRTRLGERLGRTIPAIVGEAAWEGYAADGHGGQSCARVHERGGFGFEELGYYICRAIDAGRIEIRVIPEAER